ncbi:hypothetical protein QFC22_003222 [Naganishia vaughanmartiniae]|uniref:Uncharacterized protein n=1 Tax=Naganishia vaughanmartiniae TaxID=1424756 RepID=A0ACC2X638_9TREE|nr:hypothetical protein QFC22_003222 [Naganishia vaughanmartiniae]
MLAVESTTAIGELNRGEKLNDFVSSPQQDTNVVPDDLRAFVIQTLADLPEERVSSAKQFQLLKTQERLMRARNVPSVPRLPYELIANFAQHLQGEISVEGFYSARRTLAKLNRTSRAVHEDVDLRKMFPRIELLSVATKVHGSSYKKQKGTGAMLYEQNLRVVLFKPVTIDGLQSLCLQIPGNSKRGAVCMFGIQMVNSFTADSGWIYVSHITDMTVCPGAGILAPSFATMVNTNGAGLRIEKRTLIPMLSQLASGDLHTTNLRIAIEGDLMTRAIVREHLEVIAETYYSRGWYYDLLRRHQPFVDIDGCVTVPSSLARNLVYGREQIDIETNGSLSPAEQGFTSSILAQTNFWENDDPSGGGEYHHIKAYLCDHVPVPEDW